jgi:hypothetical protein
LRSRTTSWNGGSTLASKLKQSAADNTSTTSQSSRSSSVGAEYGPDTNQ